ncbi:MAG: ATP-dependent DNA helicase [Candidatus Omnitrophota bacterium]|jgi:DNA helicase-2/ATP-dependent DNA helicase PcrA
MKDFSQFYNALNKTQVQAVDSAKGPVLVLAGPGTGKTELLSVRAASIIDKGYAAASNILILTYTNSAVKEMKERLARIIGLPGYDVEVGTFHSFANSIIQESEDAANYVGDKIQMNELEGVRAIEHILDHTKGIDEIRPFGAPYIYLGEIMQKIGALKRDGVTPGQFEKFLKNKKEFDPYLEDKHIKRLHALSIVYREYEELKDGKNKDIFDDRGRYDFDDMIMFATEALKNEPGLKSEYQKQFTYVMIDEFQDTNGSQLELLFTLLDYKDPNLCCVGDDDQSIYRFQGASVGNFKLLKDRYPNIKMITLVENYRSTKELIDLSAKMIGMIPKRERAAEKNLTAVRRFKETSIERAEFSTEQEELIFLIDKVKAAAKKSAASTELTEDERKHPFNNIAILVRKRNDILKIVDALLQAGVPYATDGKEDISSEKRVKQLLDVLELAHIDPAEISVKDMAFYKVLTADYFEIPLSDTLRFISYVNSKKLSTNNPRISMLAEFLSFFKGEESSITFEKIKKLEKARDVIQRLLDDAQDRSVHSILIDFIKDSNMLKFLLREYQDKDVLRIRELRALTSFVNMVKATDLSRPAIRLDEFMDEIKTRRDHGLPITGSLVTMTQSGVRVFTAHGSKGRQFHTVIIPFCLQNKNWPARVRPEMLPMPSGVFKGKEHAADRSALKQLYAYDEMRLFYVAMTRAKANLIFTASPNDDTISSSYLDAIGLDAPEAIKQPEEETMKEFLESTDSSDPFIGTEKVLADMVANITLNPTRVNTYLSCHRKFLYNDVLKLPGPRKKNLVFGNCVHKALEDSYTEYQKTGSFPSFEFFKKAFERELAFQGADSSIEAHCKGQGQMQKLQNWFERASRHPVMPIGLERKLLVTIGDNIIFTGKYDKVEWADEKRALVKIIDYKTGKPDKHLKAMNEIRDLAGDECDGYLRQLISTGSYMKRISGNQMGARPPSGNSSS